MASLNTLLKGRVALITGEDGARPRGHARRLSVASEGRPGLPALLISVSATAGIAVESPASADGCG